MKPRHSRIAPHRFRRRGILPATLLAALMATALAAPLAADVVTMRNGTVLTGKIITQSKAAVQLRTDAGDQIIPKSDIIRIVYRDEEAEKRRLEQLKAFEERRQQQAEKKAEDDRKAEEARRLAEEKRREDDERKRATEKPTVTPGKPSKWKAMAYSAILPGAGQIYQGNRERGSYILGSFLASAALTYRLNRGFHWYQNELDSRLVQDIIFTPAGARASGLPIDATAGAVLLSRSMDNIAHLKTVRTRLAGATVLSGSLMAGLYGFSLWDTHRGAGGTQSVLAITPDGGLLFAVTLLRF